MVNVPIPPAPPGRIVPWLSMPPAGATNVPVPLSMPDALLVKLAAEASNVPLVVFITPSLINAVLVLMISKSALIMPEFISVPAKITLPAPLLFVNTPEAPFVNVTPTLSVEGWVDVMVELLVNEPVPVITWVPPPPPKLVQVLGALMITALSSVKVSRPYRLLPRSKPPLAYRMPAPFSRKLSSALDPDGASRVVRPVTVISPEVVSRP